VVERTSVPPVIDGRLDDPAWTRAPPSNVFTMKMPREGVAATEETVVRVLYDDRAVYVAFDCVETLAPVVARATRRDRAVESDWVSVSLDTRRDGRTAFEFVVNAAGVLSDGIRYNDTDYSADWDENWVGRTATSDNGWSAEIEIPLRVLRFASLPTQSWGFEARRYVSARQELDEWQYIPRSVGGEVSRYGLLIGLRDLHPSRPVELWTTALGRVRSAGSAGLATIGGASVGGSLGLDAKWHATDDLTLAATYNPDFAQVEADQLVLNLTTFETWYPEKRPFFLEGLDAFATPFSLLYTRRIGRPGPAPSLRTSLPGGDERLVDVPDPATIDGATKLVGVVSDGWRVAVLDALVAPNQVDVLQPGGGRASRLVDPLTVFQVARVRRIVGERADLGLMVTAATRAEPTGQYPLMSTPDGGASQLCPDGTKRALGARCFHDAYVAGVDAHWRSVGGEYALTGQAVASLLGAGAPVTFPDGTLIAGHDLGAGLTLSAAKQGGEHWVGNVDYTYEGRKLDFEDLGFMDRQNQHYADAAVEYRRLTPWWKTLEAHARIDVVERDNTDGLSLGRSVQLSASARTTDFWVWWGAAYFHPAHFDDREVGDGTALERAGLVGAEVYASSDPRTALSLHGWAQAQVLSDGWQVAADIDALWHATSRLDIDFDPSALFTAGEPRFAQSGPLSGQYSFGRLAARNVGATLRATYTFTPSLTLQAYAQLFVAAGHYTRFAEVFAPAGARPVVHLDDLRLVGVFPSTNPDFEQAALNVNLVLRWEFVLGSTLFAVYTRSQTPNVPLSPGEPAALDIGAIRRAPTDDALVLKLSYWWG
jgi:Domain of unknown function (DUF5916)/Carbohydrate family 9 binding domain-like